MKESTKNKCFPRKRKRPSRAEKRLIIGQKPLKLFQSNLVDCPISWPKSTNFNPIDPTIVSML